MQNQKAAVREAVERIPGVTRTWFEWVLEGGELLKRLVVEVSFDTACFANLSAERSGSNKGYRDWLP